MAANELCEAHGYRLGGVILAPEAMAERVIGWVRAWPILSIEDPLAQHDFVGMAKITQALGGRVQMVGDDLLATNAARVTRAAAEGADNACLLYTSRCV